MKKLLIIFVALGLIFPYIPAKAISDFNPNMILSDEELQNYQGWTVADVQKFLVSKNSSLSRLRQVDLDGITKTAAEIIYNAAVRNKINPKFILTTLQKEQSLITASSPSQKQLDWATGYAVCDGCYLSNPKVQKHKGFAKQVEGAAGVMRWYYKNKYNKSYIKKKNVPITISKQSVTPQSWATAFLYTYTPHLHGNKNFWIIWNKWFAGQYPNGTLFQAATSKDYWLLQDGKKRKFKSKSALISRVNPDSAIIIQDTNLKNYKNGSDISFPNYSILKTRNSTYLLDYNTIRKFDSAQTVRKIGYNPQEAIEVNESDLSDYTRGSTITSDNLTPQGVIYKITDLNDAYYLFKDNTLFPITDNNIITTNFNNLEIKSKPKKDILNYEVAMPIIFKDGTLLKIKNSNKLFVVEDGLKRKILDDKSFLAMGYSKSNLIEISLLTSFGIRNGKSLHISNPTGQQAQLSYLGDLKTTVTDICKPKVASYIIAEYPSGKILSGKNIDKQRPIASLTKLVTAYESLEQGLDQNKSTTYYKNQHISWGNPLRLISGEKLNNKDLLNMLLISSVNSSARMLATANDLSEGKFINAMNAKVKKLGAKNTQIADTTGISRKNLSTPRDLLKLFTSIIKNDDLRKILAKNQYSFKETLNKNNISLHNIKTTNKLLNTTNEHYKIIASKTGYTDEAKSVLIMLIESKKTNSQYVILTMGNNDYQNRFKEPNRLAEWATTQVPTVATANVK